MMIRTKEIERKEIEDSLHPEVHVSRTVLAWSRPGLWWRIVSSDTKETRNKFQLYSSAWK
jgi:hypothetical protein